MKLTTDWSFSEACFTNCRLKAFSIAPLVQSALSIRYTPQYKPPHKAMIFHPTVWLEKHELEWTSYHQSHKPVSHGVSKAFSFGKAKDTGTWKSFVWEKSRVFLFPAFVSLGRFLQSFQFSFAAYFARQRLFLMFSFKILREKLKHGRQEMIPSRMPDV